MPACLTKKAPVSHTAYDWEHDLGDVKTKPSDLPTGAPAWDQGFCRGVRPGACLSLIIRVPKSDLVQDIGLSTLALGGSSKAMRSRLDEACQAAWGEYRQKYLYDTLHPVRRRLVTDVAKMRCIYLFMSEEVAQEDTKLAANEIAFSTRLTNFAIAGTAITGTVQGVGLQLKDTAVRARFRSAAIFGGTAVSPQHAGWQSVTGLGAAPVAINQALNREIHWQLDLKALAANLGKVATNGPAVQASVAAFFSQAKTAIGQIPSTANPAAASLLLIGMGYNAYRTMCGENAAACKVETTNTDMNPTVNHELADLVPSSETNELFRLAVVRTVEGILDQLLVSTNPTQLADKFGVQ